MAEPHHPLLKAEEINSAMKGKSHYLNQDAERIGACMSDMVGMQDSGLGVHKQIHYHLHDSEWIYILSGSGSLQLIDSTLLPSHLDNNHPAKGSKDITSSVLNSLQSTIRAQIEEKKVEQGDFIGFQGGVLASRYAHGLKAGEQGIEYLMGGTREKLDICIYPELGVSNIADSKAGKKVLVKLDTLDLKAKE